ncbi:MAG: hypothetical protein V3U32_01955 [Anaerolineales bacterium]
MKTALGIFGILLVFVGVVWFFQGIGVIPRSPMTGQAFWAVAGFLAVLSGGALIRSWRRKQPASVETDSEGNQSQQESQ